MNCIEEILAKYPMVVLDGAFATELEARGFDINDALWSAKALHERPDLVKEVHLDYLRAGADVVESASYQAT
ncbi:MAG: homocysteine S-methyltransferase family protein, partial [Selenomonadaceae bacterium]|nr:homocysteine S-methyltransferase family protein [Selenomonadaceae bacterium]